MLQGVICDYLSQLCTFTKQIAVNVNNAQSLVTISNNVVIWMIISGLLISMLAGLAFSSIIQKEMVSSYGGLLIIFTAVGMVVLQSSELAYLVIVKFISVSVMAVFGDEEQEIDHVMKMIILAGAALLLLILNTRYNNQAFPALVTDVVVASVGLLVIRAIKFLPCLIPFIVLGVAFVILRNHGVGADVMTEFFENLIHGVL